MDRSEPPRYKTRSVAREEHALYLERSGLTQEEHEAKERTWRRHARGKNSPDPDSDPEVSYTIRRKKTRSMQRERRQRRRLEEQAGIRPDKAKHSYTPDYRFYLKGGDVYLVVENVLFCVHIEKLVAGGGFFSDLLTTPLARPEEKIRDRPLIHVSMVTLREIRFYLAYLYRTILIRRPLPSGTPLLYWEAALSVLLASHKLGDNLARQAAIKGLETLFPLSSEPVPFKPAIAGLRTKEEETNFYRTFPLQAIPAFRQCDMEAMLPMAFYHAAQLTAEDLLEGFSVGDQFYKLDRLDAELALEGHETLKNARNDILLDWLPRMLERRGNGPRKASPGCADLDLRGGLACYPFLQRLKEQTMKHPHNVATHALLPFSEQAKEVLQENLCFNCLEMVLRESDESLTRSWAALPGCFEFESWEVLLKRQKSNEDGWAGDFS